MAESKNVDNSADTRTMILNAVETIMASEGYAGVSSRKVAAQAGLKSNIVHYYFKTMDDLFIACFRRIEDIYFSDLSAAGASIKPLHKIWDLGMDAAGGNLVLEFNAVARHRPKVREVMAQSAKRDRLMVGGALGAVFDRYEIDKAKFPPKVVALLMAGLQRAMAIERALGTDDGHDEAVRWANDMLLQHEP